jgi:hypothetical protein
MKVLLYILFILLAVMPVFSQESFRVEWGTDGNIAPNDGIVDTDGNLIIVGSITDPKPNYDKDAFIFKMDSLGEYSYFVYPAPEDSIYVFDELIQTDNGNYFVFCYFGPNDNDNPDYKYKILHFDQDLNIVSEKDYELKDTHHSIWGLECIKESNGNILCAGSIVRKDSKHMNNYIGLALLRFNQAGDTIETVIRHYERHISVFDIDKIPDSENYLILEWTTQLFGDFECYILKPDLSEECINFHSSYDYSLGSYSLTNDYWYPDKTFLMADEMYLTSGGSNGLGVFRCDTLANISDYLFLDKPGIYDGAATISMAYADENSIFIAGYTWDYGNCANPDSIELYVVDTALNQIAYKSLGGDMSYYSHGVLCSKNKDAFIFGTAGSEDNDCRSHLVVYRISREELGLPPVKVLDIKENNNLFVYPNPANDIINIRIKKGVLTNSSRIKLFNSQGKKIYDYLIPTTGNALQLNISNLDSGVYIYKITNKNETSLSGTFIKK